MRYHFFKIWRYLNIKNDQILLFVFRKDIKLIQILRCWDSLSCVLLATLQKVEQLITDWRSFWASYLWKKVIFLLRVISDLCVFQFILRCLGTSADFSPSGVICTPYNKIAIIVKLTGAERWNMSKCHFHADDISLCVNTKVHCVQFCCVITFKLLG